METKHEDEYIKTELQLPQFPHYFSVPPIGLSGGLSLFWKDGVEITILESSPNLIDTQVKHKGVTTFISFIYGAPAMQNRAEFWEKLSDVGKGRDLPRLVSGDFNEILNNTEKVGGPARWEGSFVPLRTFVSQHGLWDLKHSGKSFILAWY